MSTRRHISFAAAVCGAFLFCSTTAARALNVGDEAPEIAIAHWAHGDGISVAAAKKEGKVLVVEFWATWCGPCRTSIPHLSELYNELGPKGLSIVGVSREKKDDVTKFVEKGDPAFSYHVGVDDSAKTHGAYMEGVDGIPHAFVIDQKGVVAWAGHPMAGMDAVVRKILAGKFDPQRAKRLAALQEKLNKALQKGDYQAAETACDAIAKEDPADEQAFSVKAQLCRQVKKDRDTFRRLHRERASVLAADPAALAELAGEMLDENDASWTDLPTAVNAAKSAASTDGGKTSQITATLARAYYRLGLVEKAIATQRKAVGAAKGADKNQAEATLAFYQSVKEEAAKHSGPGTETTEEPAPAPAKASETPEAPKAAEGDAPAKKNKAPSKK